MFLVYLRLCSPSEVESISSQLPSTPISSPAAGKQAVGSMENAENADPNQKITDQYKGVLNAMQFLRVPYVMDIISILGDGGCSLSARLISGLHSLRPSFAKESADAFKEVVNVRQFLVVLFNASKARIFFFVCEKCVNYYCRR